MRTSVWEGSLLFIRGFVLGIDVILFMSLFIGMRGLDL